MRGSVRGLAISIVVTLSGAYATYAHAMWTESIPIVGAPVPAGARVSLTLPDGDVVPGTVREEDDGQTLVFVLPGDRPSSGTIVIATDAGTRRYALPSRSPGEAVELDLRETSVTVSGGAPREPMASAPSPGDQWDFAAGVSGYFVQTDYFRRIIADQAVVLDDLFTDAGATNNVISDSADDSGSSFGALLGVRRHLNANSALYFNLAWMDDIALDGSVRGTGDLGPNTLQAVGVGESELQLITAILGYERAIGGSRCWRWFLGAGYARAEFDDESESELAINGMPVVQSESSGEEDDNAAVIEAGVRLRLRRSVPNLELEIAVQQTDELFANEGATVVRLGLTALF